MKLHFLVREASHSAAEPSSKDFYRLGPLGQASHRVAMSVCQFVPKVVIVNNSLTVTVLICFPSSNRVYGLDLGILNLEGNQNCMIGSKVTAILMMLFPGEVWLQS